MLVKSYERSKREQNEKLNWERSLWLLKIVNNFWNIHFFYCWQEQNDRIWKFEISKLELRVIKTETISKTVLWLDWINGGQNHVTKFELKLFEGRPLDDSWVVFNKIWIMKLGTPFCLLLFYLRWNLSKSLWERHWENKKMVDKYWKYWTYGKVFCNI